MSNATDGMMATKRPDEPERVDTSPKRLWPIGLAVAVLCVVGLWIALDSEDPEMPSVSESIAQAVQQTPAAPVIPVVEEDIVEEASAAVADPITPENAEDRLQSLLAGHPGLERPAVRLFSDGNLFARLIAVIDALSQGEVPYKLLPLPAPMATFPVDQAGATTQVSSAGFARYNALVVWVTSWDPQYIARLFHAFRPALEQGYSVLGYAPEQLDDAVLGALDNITEAGDAVPGALLVKKESVWRYADAELERRSALEKQMMRMGPENSERLRTYADDLKRALLQ